MAIHSSILAWKIPRQISYLGRQTFSTKENDVEADWPFHQPALVQRLRPWCVPEGADAKGHWQDRRYLGRPTRDTSFCPRPKEKKEGIRGSSSPQKTGDFVHCPQDASTGKGVRK